MSAWQPIESAPKGMVVIGWFPPAGAVESLMTLVVWAEPHCYCPITDSPLGGATHWMPLPPPPLSAEEEMGAAHEPDEVAF